MSENQLLFQVHLVEKLTQHRALITQRMVVHSWHPDQLFRITAQALNSMRKRGLVTRSHGLWRLAP